jgi:hypothetical protein
MRISRAIVLVIAGTFLTLVGDDETTRETL